LMGLSEIVAVLIGGDKTGDVRENFIDRLVV